MKGPTHSYEKKKKKKQHQTPSFSYRPQTNCFSQDSKPASRRTRQSNGPKVRTGCITCKTQRVKCDETKPSCLRCIKWGGKCDGYAPAKSSKALPGTSILNPIIPLPISPAVTKPLCRSPDSKSPFTNDLEYHSFQRFAQHTARHLTGFRESQIWSRVVLQASEGNEFIRHAVTAIGALNFQNWMQKYDEKERLEFAYQEYDKAILGLRKASTDGTADIRTKLISCILFACFEAYHGNNEIATGQVFSGIEMMEQYKRKRFQAPSPTTEYVPRSQPAAADPQPLDPEIVETLILFEIQFSSYADARTSEAHRERMQRFGHAADHMPKEFTSLSQASAMLSRILLWGIHVRFTQDGHGDDFVPPSPATITTEDKLPPLLGLRSCANVYAELAKALNKYTQWQSAFAPILATAKRSPGSALFHGAALLQIYCLSSYIWLASGSPSRSMYYRKHTRLLREIVSLAKILNAQEETGCFSSDFRTVLPLMIVSSNYRHIGIRREVIEIFEREPRREGLWDSRLLGRIARWVAGIEEVGLSEGEEYVPEGRVVEIVEIRRDGEGKVAFVRCRQGEGGEGVFYETTLYW